MKFTTDIVIGLEIHVELNTDTKLFCGCTTKADLPNTACCPICLGHPGSKPVLNKKCVDFAIMLGLALNCQISKELIFSRKSYFYPDMARNYQITQFELPLCSDGYIILDSGKKIRITRAHLEEDPAALVHHGGITDSNYVLVDYNRSGHALCEIVTEPDMQSPEEAREFLNKLLTILQYIKVFDPNMNIIKADANISIKESGYVRSEVKNITGFKDIERALFFEVQRQKKAVENGETLIMDTRAWDSEKGMTTRLRVKEQEQDYGYILDPDLVITDITDEWISSIKEKIPELPSAKIEKFIKKYQLKEEDAKIIAQDLALAEMLEKIAAKVDPVLSAKWVRRELVRVLNYNKITMQDIKFDHTHLIELLLMVQKRVITDETAKRLIEKLVDGPFNVREYVQKEGLMAVSDTGELEKICKEVISENAKVVEDYKSGNEKSFNFLVGQVMRKSQGKASPDVVNELLKKMV